MLLPLLCRLDSVAEIQLSRRLGLSCLALWTLPSRLPELCCSYEVTLVPSDPVRPVPSPRSPVRPCSSPGLLSSRPVSRLVARHLSGRQLGRIVTSCTCRVSRYRSCICPAQARRRGRKTGATFFSKEAPPSGAPPYKRQSTERAITNEL